MKTIILLIFISILSLFSMTRAADAPPTIDWNGKDIGGADVKVPVDRTSIVAFVRGDQPQSKDALKQIQAAVTDAKMAQVLVILSGPTAVESAKAMQIDVPSAWRLVADAEFAASGKMNIHVWPTTLVVKSDGTQVAHLAGMPKSFSTDLKAYLDYAAGKLDDTALQKRLTTEDVITDSPAQIASRHLQIAQRLLEQGQIDQAESEINEGLKRVPNDPMLELTLARVMVMKNQPKLAIELLDKLPTSSTPAWQGSLIRGRALIALERWTDAKAVLPDALKLNPDPAEAHYLLGLCFQHDQDWPHATEQFRLAFEKSPGGSKLINKQP
jgi:tetratricopeptide (TPR) repeat protein